MASSSAIPEAAWRQTNLAMSCGKPPKPDTGLDQPWINAQFDQWRSWDCVMSTFPGQTPSGERRQDTGLLHRVSSSRHGVIEKELRLPGGDGKKKVV
ncbi:MAG TPA: hypothetical protein VN043_04435 [Rhodanobacter sp.]|nr:hypothetical protein [Rhodanobacter sp.]